MEVFKNWFFIIGLLIISFSSIEAQNPLWVDMMEDPNAKFDDIVDAFDEWWGDRTETKGTGFKQFQRWKYYHQDRLTPDGRIGGAKNNLQEFQKYAELHNLNGGNRSNTGADWTEVGPVDLPLNGTGQPNGVGRLTALAFHPSDPDILFVGAPAGGFLKSEDYGDTWENLSFNLTRLGVSSIVVHPDNPDTIYIGTGDRDAGDAPGYGVWRSIDGGQSWNSWNSGMGNRTVYEILMHPNDPDIMIASTNGRIYRTTNGGSNWVQELSGENLKDLSFHPTNPNIVYASGQRFYRSDDNGLTWTQITSGLASSTPQRIAIAVSEDKPNYLYLFYGNGSGFQGLYRSTNSGLNFTLRSSSPNICGYDTNGGDGSQAWYDLVALGDPDDGDHIIIGAINLWESFDGGTNWSIVSHWYGAGGNPDVHADQHVLMHSPHTGHLFAGHDGGLHFSTDQGDSFYEISDGLGIGQIYKIGQSALERELTIAGFQDNGTALIDNGVWRTEIGGDGMECIVDYSDSDVMYGALYYGDVRRSTNRGFNFSRIAKKDFNGITESGGWITPYKLHPTNRDTMYIGYKNIWRSYNCATASSSSVSWTKVSDFPESKNIVDIGISIADPNKMYVSRSGNKFFSTNNIHVTNPVWVDLTSFLPVNSTVRDIEISPLDASVLWIAQQSNIYKSIDGGLSWVDVSGTLPNLTLNSIVAMPDGINNAMYVGMDVGVYYIDDNLPDWLYFGDFLPNTEVLELELYIDENDLAQSKLIAATYGRGIWHTPAYFVNSLPPGPDFSLSINDHCTDCPITLFDESFNNPNAWLWEISPSTYSFVGGTDENTQNPQLSFSAIDSYTISLTAYNENGSSQITKVDHLVINSNADVLPFVEDFESIGLCDTDLSCGDGECTLNGNWENFQNGIDDEIDWRIDNDGTPSNNTGPSVDYNPGNSSGKYAYTEATGCFSHEARMKSKCISLDGTLNPVISFAYHMNGEHMGSLHLDLYVDGSWVENIMTPISGNQGNVWHVDTVNISAYIGKNVRFQFRAKTGFDYQSDIALDDIRAWDSGGCLVNTLSDAGPGSLRHCIDESIAGTRIFFDNALQGDTIMLSSGNLIIDNDLEIVAPTSLNLCVSGAQILSTFEILAGTTVEISGIDVISGMEKEGRAIINRGNLTLEDVNIYDLDPPMPPAPKGSALRNLGEIIIIGDCNIEQDD